jgi:hypothetical protein
VRLPVVPKWPAAGIAADVIELRQVRGLSSFGVDGLGRVHVTSTRGDVLRLDPR